MLNFSSMNTKRSDRVLNYMLLALDRASVRTYDHDGRLHVAVAHISKANVCPYLGKEIPNAEMLGLKPRTVYQLLRDPDELAKAVKTLNNIQLLIKHDPVSTKDPKNDLIIGSTGTDAVWNAPYLDNSLVVWDQDAIDGIEDETQKELSAGYYYTADMTPGIYEGVAYDGVMRNIRFNHVALIVEGRAGDDVVVGDSMEVLTMKRKTLLSRKAAMAKGAIAVCLSPRLAQDKKIDLNPVLTGVSPENWGASKKKITEWLRKLPVVTFSSKLAMDAGVQDVVKLLDSLDKEDLGDKPDDNLNLDVGSPDAALEETLDPSGTGMTDGGSEGVDSPEEAISALLQGKVDDATLQQVMQLLKPVSDDNKMTDGTDGNTSEVDSFMDQLTGKKKAPVGTGNEGGEAQDADPASTGTNAVQTAQVGKGAPLNLPAKPVTSSGGATQESPKVEKAAMDAAILKAKAETKREVTQQLRDIAEAEKIVKPYIGEVQAMDSAEAVYRLALDQAGVDLEGVHTSAFKAMVLMLRKPGEDVDPRPNLKLAHDSKSVVNFKDLFPTAGKVRQLG